MNKLANWIDDWGVIVFSVAILGFIGFVGSPKPVDEQEITVPQDGEQYLLEEGHCLYKEGSIGYEKYICTHQEDIIVHLEEGTYKLFD